jgi:hypothetical protein
VLIATKQKEYINLANVKYILNKFGSNGIQLDPLSLNMQMKRLLMNGNDLLAETKKLYQALLLQLIWC